MIAGKGSRYTTVYNTRGSGLLNVFYLRVALPFLLRLVSAKGWKARCNKYTYETRLRYHVQEAKTLTERADNTMVWRCLYPYRIDYQLDTAIVEVLPLSSEKQAPSLKNRNLCYIKSTSSPLSTAHDTFVIACHNSCYATTQSTCRYIDQYVLFVKPFDVSQHDIVCTCTVIRLTERRAPSRFWFVCSIRPGRVVSSPPGRNPLEDNPSYINSLPFPFHRNPVENNHLVPFPSPPAPLPFPSLPLS